MEEENQRDDYLHNLMGKHQHKHHPDDRDNTREDHGLHQNNELTYCPLFKGLTQSEHDDFLERNVKEMEEEGTIELKGKRVRVLDRGRLIRG